MGGVERRRWLVEGLVQGVFFRESTRRAALEIGGIAGFVRNLPDGRVEVVAEGPREALERLRDFIRRGPPQARVDGLVDAGPAPAGELAGFSVLRR